MRETMETLDLSCHRQSMFNLSIICLFPKSVSLTHLYSVLLFVYYFIVVYTNT